MIDQAGPAVSASARELRVRLRRARRAHRTRSLGDLLTDLYMIAFLLAIYGWAVVDATGKFFRHQAAIEPAPPGARYWIAVGFGLALAGLAWQGLAALGPLQISAALQSWVASTPAGRRALLAPRYAALVAATSGTTGVLALAAVAVGRSHSPADYVWATLAGLTWGAAAAGWTTAAQAVLVPRTRPATPREDVTRGRAVGGTTPMSVVAPEAPARGPVGGAASASVVVPDNAAQGRAVGGAASASVVAPEDAAQARAVGGGAAASEVARRFAGLAARLRAPVSWVLILLGGGVVLGVVVAAHLPVVVARPTVSFVPGLAAVGVVLAVSGLVVGARALPRIDRATLSTGAQFASAASSAVVLLDPSMLSVLVENRRWRAVGRVRSRRLRAGSRTWVLLQAELRRVVRHPSALAWWVALVLALYAVAAALPAVAGPAQVIGAYVAAERLAGGLRAVSRSAGLRRALGGGDTGLKLTHLLLPAVAAAAWWLATLPAVGTGPLWLPYLLVAGVAVAVYRSATRGPMTYGGAVAETPFGTVPVDLIRQVIRGVDVVAALVAVQLLAR